MPSGEQHDRSAPEPAAAPARIVLLTDFGTRDGYPASMRGVIAGIAPHACVDDATHDITPGDVHSAAYVLARYARFQPRGTIHLAVVDPGVGSARRAIAAEIDGQYYVTPDNGLLTRVLRDAASSRVVELDETGYHRAEVSATFHGRDIFAPAAAWLARGVTLDELGHPLDDPVLLDLPQPQYDGAGIEGVVEYVDHFGNLITNIPGRSVAPDARVAIAGREVGPVRRTYADVVPGSLLALIGSDGMLEIAVRNGSAATLLGVDRGAAAIVRAPAGSQYSFSPKRRGGRRE
jgi:S-adenosylmethionine hydrolase